ncbi:MAG TPA: hypothetical protein EYN66_13710 [Myxococcales bacterium]|nr:hypothetical protein [Myxococcales bacterium]
MSVTVERVSFLDADRAVARVNADGWRFGSIFVLGLESKPQISWPRSARGFPIVECCDAAKREEIEKVILDAVKAAQQ